MSKLDFNLISRFRERINKNGLVFHMYSNVSGKNKWSIICSAMDWIETCIDGIDTSLLEMESNNSASIKLMTFIMCIDVLSEAVAQLHRVFFNCDTCPFLGDNSVFQKEIDDNEYWKEIRAAFAAHPTNLKGKEKGERLFASWSGIFGNGDFSVIVYSNKPDKHITQCFSIIISQLMSFAEKRYMYLTKLLTIIDQNESAYCEHWKSVPIDLISKDICTSISNLITENANRFNNDNYQYRLKEIYSAFAIEPNDDKNRQLLIEYQEALWVELKEIRTILQNMDTEAVFNQINDICDSRYSYPNEHIFDYEKGGLNWAISRIKEPLGAIVNFDAIGSTNELQVLVRAGWWKYNLSLG